MKRPKPAAISAILFASILAAYGLGSWWVHGSKRAQCSLQLSTYNQFIASCGVRGSKAWKDPKTTEDLVWELFEQRIPVCPAGGRYSIVYNRGAHKWLPQLVCSEEKTRGHICRQLDHDDQQAKLDAAKDAQ